MWGRTASVLHERSSLHPALGKFFRKIVTVREVVGAVSSSSEITYCNFGEKPTTSGLPAPTYSNSQVKSSPSEVNAENVAVPDLVSSV